MISAAEFDRIRETADDLMRRLVDEVERLRHENATCASALMIARDGRHAAEKRLAEIKAYLDKLEANEL